MFLVASWDFGGIPLSLGKSLAVVRCLSSRVVFSSKTNAVVRSNGHVLCQANFLSLLNCL